MRGAIPFSFATLCRAAVAGLLLAASAGAAEFITTHKQFQIAQWKAGPGGLPANAILCLHQSRDGYLWIGTAGGLLRFDGLKFTPLAGIFAANVSASSCAALGEDDQGALWAATGDGLLRIHERRARLLTTEDGLPQNRLSTLCVLRDGTVWAGGEKGLTRVNNGAIKNFTTAHGLRQNAVRSLYADAGRMKLFAVTSDGVQQFNVALDCFVEADPPRSPGNAPAVLLPGDSRGHLWAGSANGLDWFHDGQWTTFTTRDGLADNDVRLVFEDRAGVIWCQTRGGALHRFRGDHFEPFRPALAGDAAVRLDVNCMIEDREGSFWLGTASDGLVRLRPRRLWSFTKADGLIEDDVCSVCEGPDGTVYAGTRRGLARIRDGKVSFELNGLSLPLENEIRARNAMRSVFAGRDGALWVGTDGRGLFRVANGAWEWAEWSPHELSHEDHVRCLFEDRDGNLWAGLSDKGVAYCSGRSVHTIRRADGLPHDDVRAMAQDHDGSLWFGSHGGGVFHWKDGRFDTWTTARGLSDDVVLCLHVDGDGALWIGTVNGLNRLKDGRLNVFTTGNGLADNTVNQILEDDFGCFWLGSTRGIARIKRSELNDVAEGRRRTANHLTVGEADGMASSETSGEQQPAGVKARDGRLWFPTTRGVAVIDPRAFEVNAVVPPVVIERVLAEDEPVFGDGATETSDALRPGKTLRFAAGRGRSVTFHFTANSLVDPSRVNFRFRLEGYDGAWKRPTSERFANYTNLKPGDYRFLVQACNNDGVWNPETTGLAFVVDPRFNETPAFFAVIGLVLAATVWGVHRMRVKSLHEIQRLEQFRALDAERTRIAQDMHDDLGASLTQIAVMSEVARRDLSNPQRTGEHVGRISATARSVVDDIGEIVWAINPHNDRLDKLCAYLREFAAQFFDASQIQCRLDFPDDVPALTVNAALRRNVFLVVKESLNNLVKHSGATQAEVRLRVRSTVNGESRLEIRVTDNGRGVDLESVSQFSNGLQNMRKRMEDVGGSFALEPAPARGTEIVFVVPLPADPTAKPGGIAREI